jgi:hypothetical protein
LLRWCVLAAALLLGAPSAGAVVVIEAYVGPRPPDAAATLAPLLAELEAQGMVARPEAVRARIRGGARLGLVNPSLTLTELIQRIAEATKLLQRRSYAAASGMFEAALADAHANVALLVADPARGSRAMMSAWVGLATCRFRSKDTSGGEQAMQEVVRSFPSQELMIRNGYGMEPADRYRRAAKELQTRGAGKLIITVNDPSALIFVDEWDRPRTAIFDTDALPGMHRVFVQLPGSSGWRHDVVVAPGEQTELYIDARFDAAVVITDVWIGFSFPNLEAARANLIAYAARLAREDEDRGVIVISLTTWHGRPAVTCSLYRIDTGVHLRSHAVVLDGRDDVARLRALAHAIVDPGAAGRSVERDHIAALDDLFGPLPLPRQVSRAPSRAKWVLLGGATLAVATGAALVYLDDQDRCGADCPAARATRSYGYALFTMGGIAAASASYLFYRDARDRPAERQTIIGLAPTLSGIVMTAAGQF